MENGDAGLKRGGEGTLVLARAGDEATRIRAKVQDSVTETPPQAARGDAGCVATAGLTALRTLKLPVGAEAVINGRVGVVLSHAQNGNSDDGCVHLPPLVATASGARPHLADTLPQQPSEVEVAAGPPEGFPNANSATFTLVKSPVGPLDNAFKRGIRNEESNEAALRRFLQAAPRLLQEGQVVGVSRSNGRDDPVFFTVTSLDPPGPAWVSAEHSQASLDGAQPSEVPPEAVSWLGYTPEPPHTCMSLDLRVARAMAPGLLQGSRELGALGWVFLHGREGMGKRGGARWFAWRVGIPVVDFSCHVLKAEGDQEKAIDGAFQACEGGPAVLILSDLDALDGEGAEHALLWAAERYKSILVAGAVSDAGAVKAEIRRVFPAEVEAKSLPLEDRRSILQAAAGNSILQGADNEDAVNKAQAISRRGLRAAAWSSVLEDDKSLSQAVEETVGKEAGTGSGPRVVSTRWEDVGGLEEAKRQVKAVLQPPKAARALHRSGVLLWGPPGTGKTLIARAAACEGGRAFLSVKGPELLDAYVGESERKVREVFGQARGGGPCLLFIDEADALAPRRGNASDGGGVMDRVVSQLLAELDEAHSAETDLDLVVMAATNRPDLLDPALMRPGRLDTTVFISVASSAEDTAKRLRALTRNMNLDKQCKLDKIASKCPDRFTGADAQALCSEAWTRAAKRLVEKKGQDCGPGDVVVTKQDFEEALSNHSPSLSEAELARYDELQATFASDHRHGAASADGSATQQASASDMGGPPGPGVFL